MKFLELIGFAILLIVKSSMVMASSCDLGKISAVHGNVKVERDGDNFVPTSGMEVCKGDKFITDKLSVILLSLVDGSEVTVGKDAEFILVAYEINNDKPNLALFELLKGAFRIVTGAITKSVHRCEVKTRLAVIGVRGTDFWGGFGLTPEGLDVVMLSGKGVYVKNLQGDTVELNSDGLGTTVLPNMPPYTPIKWNNEKVAKAVATITP